MNILGRRVIGFGLQIYPVVNRKTKPTSDSGLLAECYGWLGFIVQLALLFHSNFHF